MGVAFSGLGAFLACRDRTVAMPSLGGEPLPPVVAPLFAARHSKDNGSLDSATVHRPERRSRARRLLEEVEEVEVAVDRLPLLLDT